MRYHTLTMQEYWELKKASRKAARIKKDIEYVIIWLSAAAAYTWLIKQFFPLGLGLSAVIGCGIAILGFLIDVFIMEGVRD